MKIQIDGTNTINKGAELMLYSVLNEIEIKIPNSEVWYNGLEGKVSSIQTKLFLKKRRFLVISNKCPVILRILRKLNLPFTYLTTKYPNKNIDVVLDAGGFQFSDQWEISDKLLNSWFYYYSELKKNDTKIILLPQAFGPFETYNGKKIVSMLNKFVDLIFARDITSYNYLIKAGGDLNKILLYPDFTTVVKGIFPENYSILKGGVAIIPNYRMLDLGNNKKCAYFNFILAAIDNIRKSGKTPFFLNHEGIKDFELCKQINQGLNEKIVIINNLSSRELKGIISQCFLVISSRFHGAASALNSSVPCLATSWSHKYQMLFNDFGQNDCILSINEPNVFSKIDYYLDSGNNLATRKVLENAMEVIQNKVDDMWEIVWKTIDFN